MMTTKFVLPQPGDINGQVQQGGDLIKALERSGQGYSLASAGISLAKGPTGGAGALLSGAVSAVGTGVAVESAAVALGSAAASTGALAGSLSGLAACGPYGAVAAAIVSMVVTLENAFANNYQGVKYVYPVEAQGSGPSAISVYIAQVIANWPVAISGQGNLDRYGAPPGFTLAQYLSVAYPPKTTKRADLALHLMQQVAAEVLVEGIIGQNQITSGDITAIAFSSNPLSACGVCAPGAPGMPGISSFSGISNPGPPLGSANPRVSVSPSTFMSPAGWGNNEGCQAVSPMMLWNWVQWQKINPGHSSDDVSTQMYPYNLYGYNMATGAGRVTASALLPKLRLETVPLSLKMSNDECLTRALQRAPDPLFFSADLYGCVPNKSYTLYYNVDLANALVTVCGMLSKGVCTRGIVAELMQQANELAFGGTAGALGKGLGNVENVSPGFRALLDDYIALAVAEDRDPKATMASVIASYPPGFAGRSPSAAPVVLKPGESTVQHFVNLYVAGHA